MRINQVKAVNTGTYKLEKLFWNTSLRSILVSFFLVAKMCRCSGPLRSRRAQIKKKLKKKRSVTQIITMISDQNNSEYHVMFMYHCLPHFIVYHCI